MTNTIVWLDGPGQDFRNSHSDAEVADMLSDEICKILPEAVNERRYFRYDWTGSKYILSPTTVSPHLYKKIAEAMNRPVMK